MKSISFILTVALLIVIGIELSTLQNSDRFYYGFDKKIPLSLVDNKVVVRYSEKINRELVISKIKSQADKSSFEWQDDRTVIITLEKSGQQDDLLRQLSDQAEVYTLQPIYAISSGLEMAVTDEIVIQFRKGMSQAQVDAIHKKFDVFLLKTTDTFQLLRVPRKSDALTIANMYQESGLVLFAHPNFIVKAEIFQALPNDEYFARQFNLHNI